MTHKDMVLWGDDSYAPNPDKQILGAKANVRDIKLSLITGAKTVSINTNKNNVLDFIVRNDLNKYVISGSTALNIYGLLDRDCKDLDLVTTEVDRNGYSNNRYPIGEIGRLGFIEIQDKLSIRNVFSREKYNCDFFLNKDVVFREFEYNGKILKIQEPLTILNAKVDLLEKIIVNSNQRNWDSLGFQKHLNDIEIITKVLS